MAPSEIKDSNYYQYKQRVLERLKTWIKNKDKTTDIRERYSFQDEDDDFDLEFDLVVLGADESILHIYEICSEYAYEKSLEYMGQRMQYYNTLTGADVTLVYLNKSGTLKRSSLGEMEITIMNRKQKRKFATGLPLIKNLSEYIDQINSICNKEDTGLHFFFRGQSGHFNPIPGIFRNNNAPKEEMLYLEAIRRCPNDFSEDVRTFDNLVKMQHYNLPTRLLDITTNPLVALYFACQEEKDDNGLEVNGEVLVYSLLHEQVKYFEDDSICFLANLAKRPKEFNPSDDNRWQNLINDVKKDKPNCRSVQQDIVKSVFCVLPKLNNDRINRQYGAFFIFGMGDTKEQPAILHNVPDIITIDKDSKKSILNALALMGIDESTLFPETDKILKQIGQEFNVTVRAETDTKNKTVND